MWGPVPMPIDIAAMDPAEILRTWMPATTGLELMQDFFAKMTAGKRDK